MVIIAVVEKTETKEPGPEIYGSLNSPVDLFHRVLFVFNATDGYGVIGVQENPGQRGTIAEVVAGNKKFNVT